MTMSPTGYARLTTFSSRGIDVSSKTIFSPSVQLTNNNASKTIAPSSQSRRRVAVPRGGEKKARTPAAARGIAPRKPASAADGYGTLTPRPTS